MGIADGSEDAADLQPERPSKSARKREAASLQDLGVELSALPEEDLETLDLPEDLSAALHELKRLTAHGAQLRQRQYIGKLMRKVDAEPLRAKLSDRKRRHDVEVRQFQRIERWRDRLLGEPGVALPELLEEHPGADRHALEELLAKAVRERAEGRTPAAARELFAVLRRLIG
jgi:ribosome-associated protein